MSTRTLLTLLRAGQADSGGGGGGTPTTGITALPTLSTGSSSAQLGFEFTVGDADVTVTGLRWYAFGTGTQTGNVRLWRASDGALLAEEFLETTGDGWFSVSTGPLVLATGQNFTVSVRWDGGIRNYYRCPHADVTFDPAIAFVGSRYSSDDTFPSALFSSTLVGGIADIEFTV